MGISDNRNCAAKRTNRGDPTSELLCNSYAFRAVNVGAATVGTLVRMNYVEHFDKRAKPERSRSFPSAFSVKLSLSAV